MKIVIRLLEFICFMCLSEGWMDGSKIEDADGWCRKEDGGKKNVRTIE